MGTVLTRWEVLKVVRLHRDGWSEAKIAAEISRSATAVHRILIGRSHSRITGIEPHIYSPDCRCPSCAKTRREDANLDAADHAVLDVWCLQCGETTTRRVAAVQRSHGRVLCDSCDGRRG